EVKEGVILHDWTAQGESVVLLAVIRQIELLPRHVLTAVVTVDGSVKLVRATLRDSVDEDTTKISLTDVVRGQQNLIFLHSIERYRLGIGLAAGLSRSSETEQITGRRSI